MLQGAPQLTRQKLRELLHRAHKAGHLRRVRRGLYTQAPYDWDQWHIENDPMEEDPAEEKRYRRAHRRSEDQMNVFFAHYLLPDRASYRKAHDLGISERTYYYLLAEALDNFEVWLETWDASPRMCSTT